MPSLNRSNLVQSIYLKWKNIREIYDNMSGVSSNNAKKISGKDKMGT